MKRSFASIVLCTCLLLTACASSPAKDYEEAILAVDGVESVSVEYNRYAGMGDSTFIDISATTNQREELLRVVDDALRAFIESADPHEETTLAFTVHSQDESLSLTPGDLGQVGRTMSDIRKYYGLD